MSGSISESEAGGNDWDDTWKPPLTSGINRKTDVTFTWHTPWKKVEVFLITPDGQRDNISDEAAHFQPIKLQYLLTNGLEKLQNLIYRIPFINVKSFMLGVELLEISLKSIPHPGIQAEIAAVLSNETEDVFLKMIPRRPFTCSIAEEIFKKHVVDGKLILVRDDFQVYVVGRSNFKDLICSAIDHFNDLTLYKTITFDKRWKSVATDKYKIVSSLSEKFSAVLVRHNEDARTILINGRNTDVHKVVQEINRMISSLYVDFFSIDHILSELLLCDKASRLLTSVLRKLEIQLFWTIENANLFVFGKKVIPKDDVQTMISQTFIQVGFDSSSDRHVIDSNVFNDIIKKHSNTLLVMKTNKKGITIASTKAIVRVLLQLDHAYYQTDVKSVQVDQPHKDMFELLIKNSELENIVQMLKVQHRDALAEIENFKMKSNANRVPQHQSESESVTQKLGLSAGCTNRIGSVSWDQMALNDPSRGPSMTNGSEDEDKRNSLNNLDAENRKKSSKPQPRSSPEERYQKSDYSKEAGEQVDVLEALDGKDVMADQTSGNISHHPSPSETKRFLGINHDVLNYFRCFKSRKLNEMLNMFSVKADVDENGEVFLSGDVENVKKAAKEFHKNFSFLKMKWSCNVVYPDEVVNKLSKTKQSIENEFHCTLAVEKDSSFVFQQQLCQIVDWRSKTHVVLVDANAHDMAADAVVVPTNDSYKPSRSGTLLLERGGPTMQTDFTIRRVPSKKQVFISQYAGSLPFQKIAYLVIPEYRHGRTVMQIVSKNLMELFKSVDTAMLQSLVIPVQVHDHIPETTFLNVFCSAFRSIYEYLESLKHIFLCTTFSDDKTEGMFQVLKDGLTYNQHHLSYYDFRDMFEHAAPTGQKKQADIVVNLMMGDLVEQKVDVIVNSSNEKLELNKGVVSKSILKNGGNRIQEECNKLFPHGIDYGLPIKTTAGKMDYRFIVHGALPFWTSGASLSSQLLQKLVFGCLKIAGEEKCSSIAFPVLGAGNLRYPWYEVARIMIHTIQKYGRLAGGQTTIKEVTIVLCEGDSKSIKAFEDMKRMSEKVILVPEDIAPPSPVILESRCDNTRVQVVSLQDVSCHQCEALVTIKSYQEVMGMKGNNKMMYKSLSTGRIYTEKKTNARWWSIYITTDKKGFMLSITEALEFAAQERLSSVAICMKNPTELKLSYKRQSFGVKEAVIQNEKKHYLMVVKVICPEIEEYVNMVTSTLSRQEEESLSIFSRFSSILTGGNKHQWKLVNNIGCVQTPRILLTAIADSRDVMTLVNHQLASEISKIVKQDSDNFIAVTIRNVKSSRWVRIEKKSGEVCRVPLHPKVCQQIDEAVDMKLPIVEICEGDDVYVYDLCFMSYSVIGKDYLKGIFYKGDDHDERRPDSSIQRRSSRQNSSDGSAEDSSKPRQSSGKNSSIWLSKNKTNPKHGTQFGYPDSTYLDRVFEELAVKGVTEKDIKD